MLFFHRGLEDYLSFFQYYEESSFIENLFGISKVRSANDILHAPYVYGVCVRSRWLTFSGVSIAPALVMHDR